MKRQGLWEVTGQEVGPLEGSRALVEEIPGSFLPPLVCPVRVQVMPTWRRGGQPSLDSGSGGAWGFGFPGWLQSSEDECLCNLVYGNLSSQPTLDSVL